MVRHYSKKSLRAIISLFMAMSLATMNILWTLLLSSRSEISVEVLEDPSDNSFDSFNVSGVLDLGDVIVSRSLSVNGTTNPASSSPASPPPISSLPTCRSLMNTPNSPFANGAFLTRRRTTPIQWKLRHDGSRELLLPHTCRLHRYTPLETRRCLRNDHLLFLGDSLTRYQFLSLAHFLHSGKWPPRFGARDNVPCRFLDPEGREACSPPEEPNICAEGDWLDQGGWPAFLQNLGGGNDGGVFDGRMESRSVRSSVNSVENMQYVSPPLPLEEEDRRELTSFYERNKETMANYDAEKYTQRSLWAGRTKLSFVFEHGWEPNDVFSPGWNFTGCAYSGHCRYGPEDYQRNFVKAENNTGFDWNHSSIVEAFDGGATGSDSTDFNSTNSKSTNITYTNINSTNFAKKKKKNVFQHQFFDANYVFYNRGLWGKLSLDKADVLFPLLREFVPPIHSKHGGFSQKNRCFYRSTTGCERSQEGDIGNWEHEIVRKAAFRSGCEYLDFHHVTEEFGDLQYAFPKPPGDDMFEYWSVFWDSVHYQPWVYEELNNLLLNILCNSSS
mmetsp:Transcript_22253/g.46639  ORF Transcript_22253/g.46639 Transcript_22253/m.46639 type:complete len:557 (+) Transcript_22253:127-1797(+)